MTINWSCVLQRNKAKANHKWWIRRKLRKFRSLTKCRRLQERSRTPYNRTLSSKRPAKRKTRIKMFNPPIPSPTTKYKSITRLVKTRSKKKRMRSIIWLSMKTAAKSSNSKPRFSANNPKVKFSTRPRHSKSTPNQGSTKNLVKRWRILSRNRPKVWAWRFSQISKRGRQVGGM